MAPMGFCGTGQHFPGLRDRACYRAALVDGADVRVLIGCEESGVVRRAFRGRGHESVSCDLLPARDGDSNHLQIDVFEVIRSGWDMVILHPPCTHIAVSGNRWYAGTKARQDSQEWTQRLWDFACQNADRVCLENPVGLKIHNVKPQWVQPWQFGHPETKKTGLWLHNLPPLEPTDVVEPNRERVWRMPPGPNRARDRATTYLGIADAMADQWGEL